MKKTLITLAAVIGLAVTGYSQGQIQFNNNSISSVVVDYTPGHNTLSNVANYNAASTFTIQLWYVALASAPTAASEGADGAGYLTTAQFATDNYTLASTITGSGGLFDLGGSVSLTGTTAGGTVLVALVAWDGSYANLGAAVAANAGVGIMTFQNASGVPLSPSVPDFQGWDATAQSVAAAAYSATGGGTYNGSDLILSPVPEPSTLVLGALGGLSLLVIRRRK
jgi:hypothetical protein